MDSDKDTLYAKWLAGDLTEAEQQQFLEAEELAELESIIAVSDQLTLPKYDAEAAYQQFQNKHSEKQAEKRLQKSVP